MDSSHNGSVVYVDRDEWLVALCPAIKPWGGFQDDRCCAEAHGVGLLGLWGHGDERMMGGL